MEGLYAHHSITAHLIWATAISCLSTLQFGFHLAVLNAPQEILACKHHVPGPFKHYTDSWWGVHGRDQCIPMNSTDIASINAMFTVGGLLASVAVGSNVVNGNFGRKRLQQVGAVFYLAGSAALTWANSVAVFNLGRLLCGLGAGCCMVVAPILVSELTPFNHRGLMGAMLQFAVGIGILGAQLIAFPWSNDQQWRNLFGFAAVVALVQLVSLATIPESPKWLILHQGDVSGARDILTTLRSDHSATHIEINHWRRLSLGNASPKAVTETSAFLSSPVLEAQDEDELTPYISTMSRRGSIDPTTMTMGSYLRESKYRKEAFAVAAIMTAQQLSGMNAITFYGVSVVQNVVPEGTDVLYLTCSLALTNVVGTLAVSPLIDRWGRKPLLLTSVSAMGAFAVVIAIGLTRAMDYVAAVGCFGFIIGYSLGLGQIPFLMVSELSSHESIGTAQSLGTMLNWLANIAVAFFFPQLRDMVGDSVFLVFLATGVFYFLVIWRFVPETKGKVEYDDVWEGYQ